MNKKVSLGVTISIAAIVCALTFIVTSFLTLRRFNTKVQAVKEKAEKYDRLEALDTYVRGHFYEKDLDEEALVDGILKGYVDGLNDPYSYYLTSDEYDALMEKESGKTVGIGVTVQPNEDGYLDIVEVEEGSPASDSGLEPGDVITGVDGQDSVTLTYPGGKMASMFTTIFSQTDRLGVIYGTKGFITVENINNPEKISLWVYAPGGPSLRKTLMPPPQVTGYEYEVEACRKALEEGRIECPEMPHAETLEIMRQMDEIRSRFGLVFPFE